VVDHVDAVTRKLQKLTPAGEEKRVIEETLEELKERTDVITKRQKQLTSTLTTGGRWRHTRSHWWGAKRKIRGGKPQRNWQSKMHCRRSSKQMSQLSLRCRPPSHRFLWWPLIGLCHHQMDPYHLT